MAANPASLQITERYRAEMLAIRRRAQQEAARIWRNIDPADLDGSWQPAVVAVVVEALQRRAASASSAYLQAFIQSELGEPVPLPAVSAATVGKARNGAPLRVQLESPMLGVKHAIKQGNSAVVSLRAGQKALTRMVGLATDTSARESLRTGMMNSPHIEGWYRAVKGTCGACMGKASTSLQPPGRRLQIHPGCQCVSEPSVRPHFKPARSKDGDTLTTARMIYKQREQFEQLGDDALIEVYHGTAGTQATGDVGMTYVTPNWYIAKGYAAGKDPLTLHVRKRDIQVSREAREAYGKGATVANALFEVGEAVVPRKVLGNLRPTGEQLFNGMTKAEQDAALGPMTAEAVRNGEVAVTKLAVDVPMETEPDFITQASGRELGLD